MRTRGPLTAAVMIGVIGRALCAWAGMIETAELQRPWPRQWTHTFIVGRHPVEWRQSATKFEGIRAAVRFSAPFDRQRVWKLSTDYTDLGRMTPGVTAVRFLRNEPTHQVIQLDVKVLWKTLPLIFDVEQDPPKAIRFRVIHPMVGDYRGVCLFEEVPPPPTAVPASATTTVEMATIFRPTRRLIPAGLLLLVERFTFLRGVGAFLDACEGVLVGVDTPPLSSRDLALPSGGTRSR